MDETDKDRGQYSVWARKTPHVKHFYLKIMFIIVSRCLLNKKKSQLLQ